MCEDANLVRDRARDAMQERDRQRASPVGVPTRSGVRTRAVELHTQLLLRTGGKRQSWLSMIIEWRSTRVCCTSVPLRDVTLTRPGMDGEAPSRWYPGSTRR